MIIQTETIIQASLEECFNVARDPDILLHSIPTIKYATVDFELKKNVGLGNKFYIDHEFINGKIVYTTKYNVTEFIPPFKFSEELTSIFFKEFKHIHEFKQQENQTVMTDTIEYKMGLGFIGRMLEKKYVENLIRNYLHQRIQLIKRKAK